MLDGTANQYESALCPWRGDEHSNQEQDSYTE